MSRGTEILGGAPAACWRRSSRRRFGTVPETHEELVVLQATRGQMNYLIDGQIVRMRPGVLLFAYAGQAHVLLSETRTFDMWVFLVSKDVLPGRARGLSLPPLTADEAGGRTGPRMLQAAAQEELSVLAGQVEAEEDPERVTYGITWWLSRAWKHWQEAGSDSARRVHPALDQAALAVRRDPALRLGELAAQAGISPEHLGRLFRAEMGEGFVKFRNRARLSRVDDIVAADPRAGLLTAALEAGFGSYAQFFRTFTELRGQAPYAYYKGSERAFVTGEAADGLEV